jgi:hypothetical protein
MSASQRVGSNYCPWWGADAQVDAFGRESETTAEDARRITTREPVARAVALSATLGPSSTRDSIRATAALARGRDPNTAIDVELFGASAEAGAELEARIAAAHIRASTDEGESFLGIDVFSAAAAAGIHNPDGSFGWNMGAMAVAVGVEGTLRLGSASSMTAGGAIGVGLEASVGLRDVDGDREPEVCMRAVVAGWTLGVCAEIPLKLDLPRRAK